MKFLRIFILFLCLLFIFNITFGDLDNNLFKQLVSYIKDIRKELIEMNKNLDRIADHLEKIK